MKRSVLCFVAITAAACAATAIHGSAMAQSSANYCELEKVRELGTFERASFSSDSKRLSVAGGNDAKLGLVISTSTGKDVRRLENVSFISHLGDDEDWIVYSKALPGSTNDEFVAFSTRRGIETSAKRIHDSAGYLIFERATGIEVLRESDATKRFLPIAGEYSSFIGYDDDHIAVHGHGSSVIAVHDLHNPGVPAQLDVGMKIQEFSKPFRPFSRRNDGKLYLTLYQYQAQESAYGTFVFDIDAKKRVLYLNGYIHPQLVPGGRYVVAEQRTEYGTPVVNMAVVDLANSNAPRYFQKTKDDFHVTTNDANVMVSRNKKIDLVTMQERPFVRDDAHYTEQLEGGKLLYQWRDGVFIDPSSRQVACKVIRVDGRDYKGGLDVSENRQFLAVKSKPASDSGSKHSIDLYRLLDKSAIESRIAELRERSNKIPTASKSSAQKVFFSAFELFQAGEFRAARTTFSQALELDPTNPQGHFLMGETLSRLNDKNTARLHYRYAVAFGAGSKESFIAGDRLASFK